MTGLHFSATTPAQTPFARQGALRFGSDDQPDEKIDKPAAQPESDSFETRPVEDSRTSEPDWQDKDVAGDFSLKSDADNNAKEVVGPEVLKDRDDESSEPVKDYKYWAKSAALSVASVAMLAASLGFLALPGGFVVSTGLALGAFLLHDYTNHVSKKTGLANITDPERLKMLILERGQQPLEMFSRLRHPFNPDKQALWVNQVIQQVHQFDPHKQLSRTGLDYQSTLDKMKAETSYAGKTFILGRFLFTAILKRGLFRFMKTRGRFVAWTLPVIWAWITGNKHGKLDDPPPQAPQPVRTFGPDLRYKPGNG